MVTRGDSIRPNSISCRDAIRELHQHIKAALPEGDPAPWCNVSQAAIELFAAGDAPGYIRTMKLQERSRLTMQRGLLTGELRAHFCDGLDARDVPGWAWVGTERNEHVWFEGRLPLDVFLPDDWQRWSAHPVFLNREAFMAWIEGQDLTDLAGLPTLPAPFDGASHPLKVRKRLPPDNPFVTLSEALSWIAFGFSMDNDQLDQAVQAHAIDGVDMEQELATAVAKLASKAAGDLIELRGKYVERRGADEATVRTKRIEPESFEDFAQFDILYDGLAYGSGLTWLQSGSALAHIFYDGQRDSFRKVKVKRADLMKQFPDAEDFGRAFRLPIPATVPDIGAVMALDEAISLLAHGRPSSDVDLWQNDAGELTLCDPSGTVIEPEDDGSPPPFVKQHRLASRKIHRALQNGSLRSYAAPFGSTAIALPRLYWNRIDPENLQLIYGGIEQGDPGAGSPVLLSREEFAGWCKAITRAARDGGKVPANRQLRHDEIISKAVELLKAQPNLSKGSAALSIVAELPRNPRTGKRRDTRHIERMIAHLWEGGVLESPQ